MGDGSGFFHLSTHPPGRTGFFGAESPPTHPEDEKHFLLILNSQISAPVTPSVLQVVVCGVAVLTRRPGTGLYVGGKKMEREANPAQGNDSAPSVGLRDMVEICLPCINIGSS